MLNVNNFLSELKLLTDIDCGTYNPLGVERVFTNLKTLYEAEGFTVNKITVADKVGPMFFATNKPQATQYDVVLVGHLDTVYNSNIVDKHLLTLKGNKAYGLGSIDMKSGVLLGLYALKMLPKDVLNKLSIAVVNSPDEEISSLYSQNHIVEICKKAKCVLVLESSEGGLNTLVNKRKGIARMLVEFKGLAAHASKPSDGASAIMELASFLNKLKPFNNNANHTTFNVNPIAGGSNGDSGASNVVANYASANLEIRFLDKTHYQAMKNSIDTWVNSPEDKGVSISLQQISYKPPLSNLPESQWLENLVLNSAKKQSFNINYITSPGGSDGNLVSSLGIPTIDGLGPIGAGWHNAELEYLDVTSIEPRLKLLMQILEDISNLQK